jgi:hypothetical protein
MFDINNRTRTQSIDSYIIRLKTLQKRYLKSKQEINPDFLSIKVNLRTAFKFTKYCCICSCSPTTANPIESHLVKAVKKSGTEITGFTNIMKSLNKRQIVICKKCHIKIHKGTYNGIKLSDFYH